LNRPHIVHTTARHRFIELLWWLSFLITFKKQCLESSTHGAHHTARHRLMHVQNCCGGHFLYYIEKTVSVLIPLSYIDPHKNNVCARIIFYQMHCEFMMHICILTLICVQKWRELSSFSTKQNGLRLICTTLSQEWPHGHPCLEACKFLAHVYICKCICVFVCVCICVCLYVCVCVCIYIYIYIYMSGVMDTPTWRLVSFWIHT
jgi:hypothetical protein